MLAAETLAPRMEQGGRNVTQRDAALGTLLGIAKAPSFGQAEDVIDYSPGVGLRKFT